jgi:hypothetical protein
MGRPGSWGVRHTTAHVNPREFCRAVKLTGTGLVLGERRARNTREHYGE